MLHLAQFHIQIHILYTHDWSHSFDPHMCVTLILCCMSQFLFQPFFCSPSTQPLILVLGNSTVHWPPCIYHVHLNALTPSFPNKQFITIFSCLVCVTIQHLVLTWAYENHLPKSMGISSKSRANARFLNMIVLICVDLRHYNMTSDLSLFLKVAC